MDQAWQAGAVVALTILLEVTAHLGIRLFLGEQRYHQMPVWVNEAIGTTILLGVPSLFFVAAGPPAALLMGALWGAALGTGVTLGLSHLVTAWLMARRDAAEAAAIVEASRRNGTPRAGSA